MADSGGENTRFLAPPAVTALKQEARDSNPARGAPMERSPSEDMREERQDLKEAAEHSMNVILDLGLDGRIKWVSPSWTEVVGTPMETVEGKMIKDILLDNSKTVFDDAVSSMKKDDSRSHIVRFSLQMGPSSVLRRIQYPRDVGTPSEWAADVGHVEGQEQQAEEQPREEAEYEEDDILSLEGQGIMVFDRSTGGESHVSVIFCSIPSYICVLALTSVSADYVDAPSVFTTARSHN